MRICRSCGRENPDESDFCTCGEYLRWEPTNYLPSVAAPGDAQANGAATPTGPRRPRPAPEPPRRLRLPRRRRRPRGIR